jgi:Zn-finger domain-containing protein
MIFLQLAQQLASLKNLIEALNHQQFTQKVEHLGNASIGGHTRHIIELLQCAIDGHNTGTLDYINRIRNLDIETNKEIALSALASLEQYYQLPDKKLNLTIDSIDGAIEPIVTTTYFREIVYNIEHTIHHLALIKVALIELKLNVVDTSFGMAYSTIKYQSSLQNA